MAELQRLLPQLNQEYKREMAALLKACQVGWQQYGAVCRIAAGAAEQCSLLQETPVSFCVCGEQTCATCL